MILSRVVSKVDKVWKKIFVYFFFRYDDKFFVLGRKIEDQIEWYRSRYFSDRTCQEYLQECARKRALFLDPGDLTKTEIYYTKKINPLFEFYKVKDPIFEKMWRRFSPPPSL